MTVIAVPYHLDEYLPDLDLPLEAAEVVITECPSAGSCWPGRATWIRPR